LTIEKNFVKYIYILEIVDRLIFYERKQYKNKIERFLIAWVFAISIFEIALVR
jgi:hypothetical protein